METNTEEIVKVLAKDPIISAWGEKLVDPSEEGLTQHVRRHVVKYRLIENCEYGFILEYMRYCTAFSAICQMLSEKSPIGRKWTKSQANAETTFELCRIKFFPSIDYMAIEVLVTPAGKTSAQAFKVCFELRIWPADRFGKSTAEKPNNSYLDDYPVLLRAIPPASPASYNTHSVAKLIPLADLDFYAFRKHLEGFVTDMLNK